MSLVPRGLTQKNVNLKVLDLIERHLTKVPHPHFKLLDIPCGEGLFAHFLKNKFPQSQITGVDVRDKIDFDSFEFHSGTAQEFLRKNQSRKFHIITCISGVMCFDGIQEAIPQMHENLEPNGLLILTNDNILTIRDRLSFLFFGHFKRFKLFFSKNEGNWNLVLPQALNMQLEKNNFNDIQIKYTSVYFEDFLFLPIALVIYPVLCAFLFLKKSSWPVKKRFSFFPFQMFYCRHYIIWAKKS